MPASPLHSLEERMDAQLHAFGYTTADEDRQRRSNGTAYAQRAGLLAGTGAAVYGGNKLRNAVINKAGAVDDYGNMVARPGMYKAAAGVVKADAVAGGKKLVKKGAMGVADQLAKGTKGGLLRNVAGKLKVGVRGFDAGRMALIVDLAERVAALELEDEDDAVEFAVQEDWTHAKFRSPVKTKRYGKYEDIPENGVGYSPSRLKRTAAVGSGVVAAGYAGGLAYKNREKIAEGALKAGQKGASYVGKKLIKASGGGNNLLRKGGQALTKAGRWTKPIKLAGFIK